MGDIMESNDPRTILSVKDILCRAGSATANPIFSNVSFDVNQGDIIVLQGKSGSG
jgi:ABC-type glutathione transport system ATPase component